MVLHLLLCAYDVYIFIDELYCVYFTDESPSSVASFKLALVVYTAEYYEIPQGRPNNVSVVLWWLYSTFIDIYHQLADLKELSLVKVCSCEYVFNDLLFAV